MSTITFDTFKFVDRLERAGMSREQAAAIVQAQKDAFSEALDTTLITRADVLAVKADVALLDAKVDKLSWMIGILIALAVANFAKQFLMPAATGKVVSRTTMPWADTLAAK